MPRSCTICEHAQRLNIERDLEASVPYRTVSARYGTSTGALQRHKAHRGTKASEEITTSVATLLPREEKLAALLAQGNISVAEACRQCGFNPSSSTIRNRLKPGGDIRAEVVRRMRELGLTLDVALLKVREKLDAKETVLAKYKGKITDTRDLENHTIQLEAAKTILELHGVYPEKGDKAQPPTPLDVETLFTDVTLPDGRVGRHMRVRIGQKEVQRDA